MKNDIVISNGGISLTSKSTSISQGGIEIKGSNKPINIKVIISGFVYFLIDCSGSMAGPKIFQAKIGALNFAKNALAKEYATGLIQFDSQATLVCEPVTNMGALRNQIQSLSIGGSTNLTEAIIIASEKLRGRIGNRVIVIVTDGRPDDPDTAMIAAKDAKKQGIDIITIGTDDADVIFLKQISSRDSLNVMVSSNQLAQGIASTSNMLPQLKKGGTP